jgi:hypothetical protein
MNTPHPTVDRDGRTFLAPNSSVSMEYSLPVDVQHLDVSHTCVFTPFELLNALGRHLTVLGWGILSIQCWQTCLIRLLASLDPQGCHWQ